MKVDVYSSGKRSSVKLLIVPAGTDWTAMTFPKDDPDLNHPDLNIISPKPYKLDVAADLFGETPNDVSDQIQAKGYAVCNKATEESRTRH